MEKKCILHDTASQTQHGYFTETIENVPDSLIEDGFVHPDSIGDYRSLFSVMTPESGESVKDVYVRTADREGYWRERAIVTPAFDRNGKHVRSVGISLDVTDQKILENKYRRQLQNLASANSPDLIAKGLYNLTANMVEDYRGQTADAVRTDEIVSYDDGMYATARRFLLEEQAQTFLRLFEREALLHQFAAGNNESAMEYQRESQDGRMLWVRTQAMLYAGCDPTRLSAMNAHLANRSSRRGDMSP